MTSTPTRPAVHTVRDEIRERGEQLIAGLPDAS